MLFLTHKFFWIVFLTYNLMTFSVCYFLSLNYFWIKNMIFNKHIYLIFFVFWPSVYSVFYIFEKNVHYPILCNVLFAYIFYNEKNWSKHWRSVSISSFKGINTLFKAGRCSVFLNGVIIGRDPEILIGCWGCQKKM